MIDVGFLYCIFFGVLFPSMSSAVAGDKTARILRGRNCCCPFTAVSCRNSAPRGLSKQSHDEDETIDLGRGLGCLRRSLLQRRSRKRLSRYDPQTSSSTTKNRSAVQNHHQHKDEASDARLHIMTSSARVVKAGTPMEVEISGIGPAQTIRGLLLQARQGDKPVGKFTVAPNDPFAKLLNCGEPGNAVTHKKHDGNEDKQSVAFTWTPPPNFNDEIKFRATIALNGAVFWVGVESAPVKVIS